MQEEETSDSKLRKKNRPIWLIASLFLLLFLLFGLGLSVYLTDRAVIFQSTAGGGGISEPSLENSYIFASPLRASIGGERIRVTVFVLDSTGKGVFGKTVALGEAAPLDIINTQNLTDETGKAVFDISSRSGGLYSIEAIYDGRALPQRVQITFE